MENVSAVAGKLTAGVRSIVSLLQIRGAANTKARLPTVDSLTGSSTKRLQLADRSVHRPGRSSKRKMLSSTYPTLYYKDSRVFSRIVPNWS